MSRLFNTASWSMQVPDGWEIREGEDGPTLSHAQARLGVTIQASRLQPGVSQPARGATVEAWRRFAEDRNWPYPEATYIMLGGLDGLRSAPDPAGARQQAYFLAAQVPAASRGIVLQAYCSGAQRAGGPATGATGQQMIEQMLATVQAYPNRR